MMKGSDKLLLLLQDDDQQHAAAYVHPLAVSMLHRCTKTFFPGVVLCLYFGGTF